MAAIFGVLRFDGAPVAGELSRRIGGRMQHRSPEGIRHWQEGVAALGFGALNATPQSIFDVQPVRLPDGAVLVVDGRIDDRPDVVRALGLPLSMLAETGDAQLFALAWLHWREELWRHVLGDYALAVWEPTRQQLHLVRDRIGVRPLYWARTPSVLAFASEAEALLGVEGVPAEPNLHRVATTLIPVFDDGDRSATLYSGVRRIMPGEILQAGVDGRVDLRRYWSFEPLEPLRLGSHDAYVEAFREVFNAAVRARLCSPSLPGLMLSGGIDSASVHASALAQGLSLRPISIVADQPGAEDERANIEAMLARVNDSLRLPVPGLEGVLDLRVMVSEVFEHAHPVRNSIILPMLVNQAAALHGTRVVLDGIDGDLVTSAPDNYVGRMALAGNFAGAWREAQAAARHHTYLKHLSPARIFGWGMASRLEPQWLASWRYRLADIRNGDSPFLGCVHPELVKKLRLRERMLEQRLRLRADPALREWIGYRHWVWMNPGFMRGMEGFDMAAGRFGVESRHPWCDQRVIDLFLRLPLDVVVRDGWTKHVPRAAYAPQLGKVAWHSGKRHLGPQVVRVLLGAGRGWVAKSLEDAEGVLPELLDSGMLKAARDAWVCRTEDASSDFSILEVVTLQRWLVGLKRIAKEPLNKPLDL